MRRKNSFRGKRVDNGEWKYGYLVRATLDNNPIIKTGENSCGVLVDEHTLGQSVHWCGYNDRMVYEGDILKLFFHRRTFPYGIVSWGNCEWILTDEKGKYLISLSCLSHQDWLTAEVLGNIHDNPELLRKEGNQ